MANTSLSNFIAFSLHKKIKIQLDLQKIPYIDILVSDPYSLDLLSLNKIEVSIYFYLPDNEALRSLVLDLVHSLELKIYLKPDLDPKISRICIEKIKNLRSNQSFNLLMILSQFEDCLREAILKTMDLAVNREWADIITLIKETFTHDVSTLKSWLNSQLTSLFLSQTDKANEEEIKFLLKSVNDFVSIGYPLQDLKVMMIDSALYLISTLISSKKAQGISKILRVINDINVPEALNLRFKKFSDEYGLSVVESSQAASSLLTETIQGPDQLKDKENISNRKVKLKDESYEISVFKAKIVDTSKEVAVKQYRSFKRETLQRFLQEIEILSILSSKPGPFLRYYGNFFNTTKDHKGENVFELNIVMEYCPENLEERLDYLKRANIEFSEDELANAARTLIEGFIIMSEQYPKIYHQDIKPENIFIKKNGEFVIADFNISILYQSHDVTVTKGDIGGTVGYMAPEIQDKVLKGLRGKYIRSKVDVYSFGVTLFRMYTRETQTYNIPQKFERRKNIIEGFRYRWLQQMVFKCLQEDYHKRPSFKELLEYLPTYTIIV